MAGRGRARHHHSRALSPRTHQRPTRRWQGRKREVVRILRRCTISACACFALLMIKCENTIWTGIWDPATGARTAGGSSLVPVEGGRALSTYPRYYSGDSFVPRPVLSAGVAVASFQFYQGISYRDCSGLPLPSFQYGHYCRACSNWTCPTGQYRTECSLYSDSYCKLCTNKPRGKQTYIYSTLVVTGHYGHHAHCSEICFRIFLYTTIRYPTTLSPQAGRLSLGYAYSTDVCVRVGGGGYTVYVCMCMYACECAVVVLRKASLFSCENFLEGYFGCLDMHPCQYAQE